MVASGKYFPFECLRLRVICFCLFIFLFIVSLVTFSANKRIYIRFIRYERWTGNSLCSCGMDRDPLNPICNIDHWAKFLL